MAKKIKLTRPELKRQRDTLTRFQRYLPMLKLKQQQLQLTMRQIAQEYKAAQKAQKQAQEKFDSYRTVLADLAGVNVPELARCQEIKTTQTNIAGVNIPVFEEVTFSQVKYSLFSTPVWVDAAIADLRQVNTCQAKLEIVQQQHDLLQKELTKIIQRVNLFEKVKIPEAREIIRRIRIQLSDEMAAAVGRAKIAKAKLAETEAYDGAEKETAAG
ncbi:MAG: V-type ATP synthase subunit D [Sedimentisphaerales bacterium]|nr:V-type ATP synthase subunit D [Sedimentisphaerales bacterium]